MFFARNATTARVIKLTPRFKIPLLKRGSWFFAITASICFLLQIGSMYAQGYLVNTFVGASTSVDSVQFSAALVASIVCGLIAAGFDAMLEINHRA